MEFDDKERFDGGLERIVMTEMEVGIAFASVALGSTTEEKLSVLTLRACNGLPSTRFANSEIVFTSPLLACTSSASAITVAQICPLPFGASSANSGSSSSVMCSFWGGRQDYH